MPRMDGTGPMGAGAMTGRGLGSCNSADVAENRATPIRGWWLGYMRGCGRGFARGAGRGMGLGRGRGMGRGFGRRLRKPKTGKTCFKGRRIFCRSSSLW